MKLTKFLLVILLCISLLPIDAIAGVFDPPATDKSIEYLSKVFGGKMGSLQLGQNVTPNLLLNSIFNAFNGIVLSIAMIILTYVGSLSVLHTAHEGEVMGKKWSSIWIPLRSSIGLLMLAPIPGSGYSLIQVTVMWVVLNGVGAADSIWDLFLTNSMGPSGTLAAVTQSNQADQEKLASNAKLVGANILQCLVCTELLGPKVDYSVIGTKGALVPYYTTPKAQNNGLAGKLNFGINDPNSSDRQDVCGSIDISVTLGNNFKQYGLNSMQEEQLLQTAYQIKRQALDSIIGIIKPVASSIASNPANNISSLPNSLFSQATNAYVSTMLTLDKEFLAKSVGAVSTSSNNPVTELKKAGWLLAGSSYLVLTRSSQQSLAETASAAMSGTITPSKVKGASLGTQTTGMETTLAAYIAALNPGNVSRLFDVPRSVKSNGFYYLTADRAAYVIFIPLAFMAPATTASIVLFNELGIAAFSGIINAQPDEPLTTLIVAGHTFMTISEALWIAFAVGSFSYALATAAMSCANPMPYANATGVAILVPVITGLVAGMWSMGALMNLYLPLIPFMIFSVTALGWMILVIEAVVAAPIVSLGLIMPAQEEIGAIKPALGMVASIFLRPILMVIGLIFGSFLLKMAIISLNDGFKVALESLDRQSGGFSSFAWIALLGLYLAFAATLVNKSYSLIYHLPDKILGWIGVSGEKTDVSDVQAGKKGMDTGTKGFSDASGGVSSGASKAMTDKYNKDQNVGRGEAANSTELSKNNSTESGGVGNASGGGNAESGGGNAPDGGAAAPGNSTAKGRNTSVDNTAGRQQSESGSNRSKGTGENSQQPSTTELDN